MLKQACLGPFVYYFSYIFLCLLLLKTADLAMAYNKHVLLYIARMLHMLILDLDGVLSGLGAKVILVRAQCLYSSLRLLAVLTHDCS